MHGCPHTPSFTTSFKLLVKLVVNMRLPSYAVLLALLLATSLKLVVKLRKTSSKRAAALIRLHIERRRTAILRYMCPQ